MKTDKGPESATDMPAMTAWYTTRYTATHLDRTSINIMFVVNFYGNFYDDLSVLTTAAASLL